MYKYAQLLYNLATSIRKGLDMEPTNSAADFWGHKHALEEMVNIIEGCSDFHFGFVDNGPADCWFEISWIDATLEGGAVKLTNPNHFRLIDDAYKLFTDQHCGSWDSFSRLSSRYTTAETTALRERGRNSWRSQVTFGVGT